jgi:uncharacterized protein (DUF2237 family)
MESKANNLIKLIEEVIHSPLSDEEKLIKISEMTADRRKDTRDFVRSMSFPLIVHVIKYFEYNQPETKAVWVKEMVNSYLNPMTGLITKGSRKVSRQQLEGWMTSCIVISEDSYKFQRMALSKMDMKKPDSELDNDSIMQVWHSFVHKVMEHYQFGIEFEVDQVQQALDQILMSTR